MLSLGSRVHAPLRLFLFIMTLWLSIWWMDRSSLELELDAYIFTVGSAGNFLPFGLMFLTFLTLFNRLLTSFLLTLSLAALFYYISFVKSNILGKPLAGEDLIFLSYLDKSTLSLFSSYINPTIGLFALAAFILIFALSVYFESRFFSKNSKIRLVSFSATLAIVATNHLWSSKVYSFDNMRFSWSEQISTLHAGLVSKIIHTEIKAQEALKEPINNDDAHYIVSHFGSPPSPQANATSPDIIIIQSESFFDPAVIEGAPETKDLLPTYYSALSEGNAGYMTVPTFGGGTIRTEYEVLTGVPMTAFPLMQFPYLQIRKNHLESLATTTKANGYIATAIHGNSGTFWNRKSIFKKAGFDNFLTLEEFPKNAKKDGYFISDESMTDLIIDQLNKQQEKHKFIFAISIEGHGPYDTSPVTDTVLRDTIPTPKGLSKSGELEYKNYLYHIHNADKELGRLKKYLDGRGKPYILVFYGDHLPGFTAIYNEITFKNQLAAKEQPVPIVIYSHGVNSTTKPVNSWSLGANILKDAGLHTPLYTDIINNMSIRTTQQKEDQSAFLSVARLQFSEDLESFIKEAHNKK